MRRTYIAAHDGTERGADAVALARLFARPHCGPVRMVHICRAREPWDLVADPAQDPIRVERARVMGVEERARLPGDPLPLNLAAHSVAHGLQDAAEREPAAVVVVASSPGGDAGRTFPGDTAERLMHGAACPVAIAPEGYASRAASGIGVIGVAVDADPESWEAVRHAIELARGFDAYVRVMTAVDPAAEATVLAVPERLEDVREATIARGQDLLRDVRRQVPGDVVVETELCEGQRGEAIVAACDEGVDLLVCGSRGYGPKRVVLLGTTTSYLVAHSSCPVLVMPRGAVERTPRRALRPTAEQVRA
jgi:nucleotide-binding universal stress UspA family protein